MNQIHIKNLLATVLASVMLISCMVIPASAAQTGTKFNDVNPGDWYYEAVTAMADAGIVNGVSEGKFNPNGKITWAQFATILWRLSLEDELTCALKPNDTITWGYKAMYYTSTYLMACPNPGNSTSCAIENDPVTRAEAASYMWDFFGAQTKNKMFPCTYDIPNLSNPNKAIILETVVNDLDTTDIPDWSTVEAVCGKHMVKGITVSVDEAFVITTIRAGIINGVDSSNTFNPNGTLTRAQFCQMLYNAGVTGPMYDKYYKGMGIG